MLDKAKQRERQTWKVNRSEYPKTTYLSEGGIKDQDKNYIPRLRDILFFRALQSSQTIHSLGERCQKKLKYLESPLFDGP